MPEYDLVIIGGGAGGFGAAIKANNIGTLGYKVTELLEDKPRMVRIRENVRRIARPRAAFDVVEKSLAILG